VGGTKRVTDRWVPFFFTVLFSPSAFSQITVTSPLSFGAFIAGNGGEVSITAAGVRSTSGSVVLLTRFGTPSQATVSLGPMAAKEYKLTLPNDDQFSLGCSGSAMSLKKFFASTTIQSFSIGATLVVSANQKPCVYSGEFPVTINFQ
jgi:hypothetical protein